MESMDNFRERLETLEHHTHTLARQARWWRGISCGLLLVGLVSLPLPSGTARDEQPTAAEYKGLKQRVADLEYKLEYVSGGPNEVVITGANLRIVNGLGSTTTTNGLGNLIVGYNEPREFEPDVRTGSHNIVVGINDNFSSFGGLVVGFENEISGVFASVSGGRQNTASNTSSSVSGGLHNTASGHFASVSGGSDNTASGDGTTVSGGQANRVSGLFAASISGGFANTASGRTASVSGGENNTASGDSSSVSGGENNTASGQFSSVSGGTNRSAPGTENWAAGPLFATN
jgi:hypothetical protein